MLNGDLTRAALGDFGLAMTWVRGRTILSCQKSIDGSYGYLCPSYTTTLRYTPASDVYAFGVVIGLTIAGESEPYKVKRYLADR